MAIEGALIAHGNAQKGRNKELDVTAAVMFDGSVASVWRFRSPHHPWREFVTRASEPKPH
jgi:hypothetical protein